MNIIWIVLSENKLTFQTVSLFKPKPITIHILNAKLDLSRLKTKLKKSPHSYKMIERQNDEYFQYFCHWAFCKEKNPYKGATNGVN